MATCQALYQGIEAVDWEETHSELNDVSWKKVEEKISSLQDRNLSRPMTRVGRRGGLLEIWQVDATQASRECEEKQEETCVSDQSRTRVTRTSPSCSITTHSSPTLQSLLFTKLRQARTRGTWWSLWFEDFYDALPFPAPPRSRFALFTFTMLWPRSAMPPLTCSDDYKHIWLSTMSTSSVATST